MYLVVDRMQVVNHLQRDQKTLEFKGEKKTTETTNEKDADKEKMQKQQLAKTQRENASEIENKSKNKQWCDLNV